ncbi:MAG: hypothetical protein K2L64_03895, partial [Ureaplasma sp.]|nr:hypothetical protein [Ureaplasma sp.]
HLRLLNIMHEFNSSKKLFELVVLYLYESELFITKYIIPFLKDNLISPIDSKEIKLLDNLTRSCLNWSKNL